MSVALQPETPAAVLLTQLVDRYREIEREINVIYDDPHRRKQTKV